MGAHNYLPTNPRCDRTQTNTRAAPERETRITTGTSSVTVPDSDPRLEHAHRLCVELVGDGNGNVPIQGVYEAMLKLIGREDVIASMRADYERLERRPRHG